MFNWQSFATPEQIQALSQIRLLTQKIQVVITSRSNRVELEFSTDDPEAQKVIPTVQEATIQSIGGTLNTLFGITGKIRK